MIWMVLGKTGFRRLRFSCERFGGRKFVITASPTFKLCEISRFVDLFLKLLSLTGMSINSISKSFLTG